MSAPRLTVLVITKNEGERLARCLASVPGADEILVVDAESEDDTREVAAAHGARVLTRRWRGYSDQRAFALSEARGEWVLSLDADEEATPALWEEARRIAAGGGSEVGGGGPAVEAPVGYRVARRSSFLGEWMRHGGWYPGHQMRLFRRERAWVSGSRVHEGYLVDGDVGTLAGEILHHSHPDLAVSLAKSNRYSTLEALDRAGRRHVSLGAVLVHGSGAFLDQYVRRRGFLDGGRGFLNAWVHAFTKFCLYAKLWDAGRRGREALEDPFGEGEEVEEAAEKEEAGAAPKVPG